MEAGESVKNLLVSSLSELAKKIENVTKRTKDDFQVSDDILEFLSYSHDLNHGIMKLLAVTFDYADCMEKLEVGRKVELEQLWATHRDEPKVEEAVKNLLQAENYFIEFVAEVDSKLSPMEDKLTTKSTAQVGQSLPDYSLIEVSSGQPITLKECCKDHLHALEEHGKELEKRGCKVVVVGIGTLSNAKEWMEANKIKFPFPVILDEEMKIYRELGIRRSVVGVWTIPILVDFAEKKLAGTLSVEHFEGDDLHILAGDFVADSSGKLILAYCSATSDDRPSVETIIAAIDTAAS